MARAREKDREQVAGCRGQGAAVAQSHVPSPESRVLASTRFVGITRLVSLQPAPCNLLSVTNRRATKGFALMDLMAAVVILGLFIMPLIMARNNTIIMASEAIGLRQARALMELKLGELELIPDEEISQDQGEFGEEYPGFVWMVEVESLPLSELVPLAEEEASGEGDSLWGFGEPDPEEEESQEQDVRDRVVLRVTVRVRYPTDVEAPEDAPPLADGELPRQPGEIVAIRLIVTDQIVGEDGEVLAPEEEGEEPPEAGGEGTPQEQPRQLVDLFGPPPGQESEEEE